MKISVVGLRGFPCVQGGVETHCENLYAKLAKTGCDLTIYGRKPYFKQETSIKEIKIIYLPCIKNQYLETVTYMLFAFLHISCNKPGIVHIHGIGPALFTPLFRLIGCKIVLTHHGADYERSKWGFFARNMLRIGEKIGSRLSHRIIVLNKSSSMSDSKKSVIIPNGVELPQERNNGQGGFIFAIGRFVKEKGFDDLIDAFCLNQDLQNSKIYRIVIAGKADHSSKYSRDLSQKAWELGVELPGFVQGDAKDKLFRDCGLFVIPSHHEGLPFTLLEAMSYNCRILASDIPEHRELELPEECYFPAGNSKILAEKIKEFFRNSESFKGCYDSVLLEKYNWDNISQRTREVYKTVMPARGCL